MTTAVEIPQITTLLLKIIPRPHREQFHVGDYFETGTVFNGQDTRGHEVRLSSEPLNREWMHTSPCLLMWLTGAAQRKANSSNMKVLTTQSVDYIE